MIPNLTAPPIVDHQNLILELKDRCDRERNIVIVGIPEINEKIYRSRQSHDGEESMKVLKALYENCPKPMKTLRLGKYNPDKNRPIKLCFENNEIPKRILRNKTKLPKNIQIYADQTPTQQQFLRSLKEEINKRTDGGERDLIIKYIKGVPRIIINTDKKN